MKWLTVHASAKLKNTYRLAIHVKPGAKTESHKFDEDTFDLFVTARPEKGEANEAVTEYITSLLQDKDADPVIVAGQRSRNKILQWTSPLSAEEIRARLTET